MNACELSESRAMGCRNPSHSPPVVALAAQLELSSDLVASYFAKEGGVGMWGGLAFTDHSPNEYQQPVYISSPHSLIVAKRLFRHIVGMAENPAFGERLEAAIKGAGFKNPRRFAIDAMGWPESSGPQRVQNYIKGRIPEIETLNLMCAKLGASPASLLGYEPNAGDAEMRGILRHLLGLAGIDPVQADTIASVALEARQLLRALPEVGADETRTRLAAHAAWRQRRLPTPGTPQDYA